MTTATEFAAVRQVASALLLWRKGDRDGVNAAVAGMPISLFIPAAFTLAEGGFATLATLTRRPFNGLVEGVVAEMLGAASEEGVGNE